MASGWPVGGLRVASGPARDAIPPVPPKTVKSRPQPPKSPIESHLRFAESFRVHGPISTSEFAAVSTPPPRNNSLCYTIRRYYGEAPARVWWGYGGMSGQQGALFHVFGRADICSVGAPFTWGPLPPISINLTSHKL